MYTHLVQFISCFHIYTLRVWDRRKSTSSIIDTYSVTVRITTFSALAWPFVLILTAVTAAICVFDRRHLYSFIIHRNGITTASWITWSCIIALWPTTAIAGLYQLSLHWMCDVIVVFSQISEQIHQLLYLRVVDTIWEAPISRHVWWVGSVPRRTVTLMSCDCRHRILPFSNRPN